MIMHDILEIDYDEPNQAVYRPSRNRNLRVPRKQSPVVVTQKADPVSISLEPPKDELVEHVSASISKREVRSLKDKQEESLDIQKKVKTDQEKPIEPDSISQKVVTEHVSSQPLLTKPLSNISKS